MSAFDSGMPVPLLNYYTVLGLDQNDDNATLRRKFRDLTLKYHPDHKHKHPDLVLPSDFKDWGEFLTFFFEARTILLSLEFKAEYDKSLSAGSTATASAKMLIEAREALIDRRVLESEDTLCEDYLDLKRTVNLSQAELDAFYSDESVDTQYQSARKALGDLEDDLLGPNEYRMIFFFSALSGETEAAPLFLKMRTYFSRPDVQFLCNEGLISSHEMIMGFCGIQFGTTRPFFVKAPELPKVRPFSGCSIQEKEYLLSLTPLENIECKIYFFHRLFSAEATRQLYKREVLTHQDLKKLFEKYLSFVHLALERAQTIWRDLREEYHLSPYDLNNGLSSYHLSKYQPEPLTRLKPREAHDFPEVLRFLDFPRPRTDKQFISQDHSEKCHNLFWRTTEARLHNLAFAFSRPDLFPTALLIKGLKLKLIIVSSLTKATPSYVQSLERLERVCLLLGDEHGFYSRFLKNGHGDNYLEKIYESEAFKDFISPLLAYSGEDFRELMDKLKAMLDISDYLRDFIALAEGKMLLLHNVAPSTTLKIQDVSAYRTSAGAGGPSLRLMHPESSRSPDLDESFEMVVPKLPLDESFEMVVPKLPEEWIEKIGIFKARFRSRFGDSIDSFKHKDLVMYAQEKTPWAIKGNDVLNLKMLTHHYGTYVGYLGELYSFLRQPQKGPERNPKIKEVISHFLGRINVIKELNPALRHSYSPLPAAPLGRLMDCAAPLSGGAGGGAGGAGRATVFSDALTSIETPACGSDFVMYTVGEFIATYKKERDNSWREVVRSKLGLVNQTNMQTLIDNKDLDFYDIFQAVNDDSNLTKRILIKAGITDFSVLPEPGTTTIKISRAPAHPHTPI